jgi:transposase InsO family protein
MDQRIQFIGDWLSGAYSKSELCRTYGISRPTGDKWIKRYETGGAAGLKELSRAPRHHPNATPERVVDAIVKTKLAHPGWGPKKVLDLLRREAPEVTWPADSTGGEILKRAGLVKPRRLRRRAPLSGPFVNCEGPNDSWSIDFKGDFLLGNGKRCHPLTISDNYSRYLLRCRALTRTGYDQVQPWLEWTLREWGLPLAMRSDNGPPFASLALGGVSRLSKWLIRLGIRPERITPGRPDQNGRHERMHRTLKQDGVQPVQTTLAAQQRQFDDFVEVYNQHRSHEALNRQTPASIHQPSPQPYPDRLPPVEYGDGVEVRSVRHNGEMKWRGQRLYVSEVLAKEPVALRQIDNHLWELRFSFHFLGYLDERTMTISTPRHKR